MTTIFGYDLPAATNAVQAGGRGLVSMNNRKKLAQRVAVLALALIGVFSILGASAADDDIVICEPQEQVIGVCEPEGC